MIIQGANEPIVLIFKDDLSGESFKGFSALLVCKATGATLKHWVAEDVTVITQTDEETGDVLTQIVMPLDEQETMAFPYGTAILEIKWRLDDDIYIADSQEMHIKRAYDRTRLMDEENNEG